MASAIIKICELITFLRKNVHPDFALPQWAIFCAVARKGKMTLPEIMKELDMPSSSASRNVKQLTQWIDDSGRHHEVKGYDLLKVEPDLYERRSLLVSLTPKGETVLAEVLKIMQ
jgi:DNA-binding MarR family transcriptional regulator